MNSFSILKRIISQWRDVPRTSYGVLNRKFPKSFARLMNPLVKSILLAMPDWSLHMIPKRLRYLTLMASHSLGLSEDKIDNFMRVKFPVESSDLVISYFRSRDYYRKGELPNITEILNQMRKMSFADQQKKIKEIIQWAFWTVNHEDFDLINLTIKTYLESMPKTGIEFEMRYLPQHTSNMGHLAMLFLYINYYRKRDPNRIIVLPKDRVANSFFLDLIVRHSPMKIEFQDSAEFDRQSPTMVDTLHYSLDIDGLYRTESDCAFVSSQEFPEFKVEDDFVLSLTDEETLKGREILENFLGHKVEWFITLHVREPKNGDLRFSQARDASVTTFNEFSSLVQNAGGLVIRMGDKNFPKLESTFPAFDYAHSAIKGEFMDVWLWANCKFWLGTVNGAAFPPLAFRIPRVITNQWYLNNLRVKGDHAVPKELLSKSGVKLSENEIITSRVARCMDREFMKRNGFIVQENESSTLRRLFLELSENHFL